MSKTIHTHRLCTAVALALGSLVCAHGVHAAAVLPLSTLDGVSGFRLDGVAAQDRSGSSISAAGDINGDGIDDLIIGAPGADPDGISYSGSSYVVFGRSGSATPTFNLSALDGSNGFRLDGLATSDRSGRSVSGAGDVNGDGIDDLIIGAVGADPNGNLYAGSSYVVFGRSDGFAPVVSLSTLDGSNGFRLDGVAEEDRSALAVSAAGDVNQDGLADLIVGAASADPNGALSGSSYVVFGRSDGFAAVINLSTLNGSSGFRLDGVAANDRSGFDVAAAGDVNGDSTDDLIIGAYKASGSFATGRSYVVFGRSGGFAPTINLSTLDGNTGFRLDGSAPSELSGASVAAAGDIDGDGIGDLIIGARAAQPSGIFSGSSYVVFGRSGGFPPVISLSGLDGNSGFRLDGVAASDQSGFDVSAAGDINGDGIDDLLVGAFGADSAAGRSYVVFGRSDGFAAAINLSTLDGSSGFRLDGTAPGDYSGNNVSAAGDFNGDGIDDLLISASGASPNGNSRAGSSYVVFGNAAPLLDAGAASAIEGLEDATDGVGSSLSDLAADVYLDAEPFAGAAIDEDASSSADGEWQYRADAGASWDTLPSGLSSSNALLLAPSASLRFVPAADYFGTTAPLRLRMWDGTSAASYTFGPGQDIRPSIGGLGGFSNDANVLPVTAEILPVNDAPDFDAANPPTVVEETGLQTVVNWASFIPGPANESGQMVLQYVVSNVSNPALFAVAPTVDGDGGLSYTLVAGANGSSGFSVQVQDDGGTANGGVDTSQPQAFTIIVQTTKLFCDGFEAGGCP